MEFCFMYLITRCFDLSLPSSDEYTLAKIVALSAQHFARERALISNFKPSKCIKVYKVCDSATLRVVVRLWLLVAVVC
jgi:hypothetical protein